MEKLDFKTLLYLYLTNANIVNTEINNVDFTIKKINKNDVYIFKNYEEYKKFFLTFFDEINDEIINLAIYTKGKKGQIIALKGLCERIIIKNRANLFYKSFSKEQIEQIHKNGKLTPSEIVKFWENNGLCTPSYSTPVIKYRCDFFDNNCHECLLEFASHNLEHNNIDFKLINPAKENKQLVLKK